MPYLNRYAKYNFRKQKQVVFSYKYFIFGNTFKYSLLS